MEILFGLGVILGVFWLAARAGERPQRQAHSSPKMRPGKGKRGGKNPAVPQKLSQSTFRKPDLSEKDLGHTERVLHQEHKLVPSARGSELAGRAWVIDGDTIRIGQTKIRLAGIDAPEIDMPFGQKSKWAMVDICKGQRITVVMHGETSFDRQVGTAYLPDGRDIAAEIVKQGLALDLAVFSGGKYRQFEPPGARKKLAYGRFGHRSLYGKRA